MRHYVYIHREASGSRKGHVFYVGKGSGNRATSSKRNFLWQRVANKNGWACEIVRSFSCASEAFRYEQFLISHYKSRGFFLTNLTSGGSGCSDCEVASRKISDALQCKVVHHFCHDQHGDEKLTQYQLRNKYKISQSNITSVVSGKRISADGWYIKGAGKGRREMLKKHRFYHPDHGVVEQTQSGLCKDHSLFRQAINDVVRGKSKSFKGWTLEGVKAGAQKNKSHTFIHESGEVFEGTQAELVSNFDVNQAHVSAVCRGARNKHKGWRILK